jgi:hypothetical protein
MAEIGTKKDPNPNLEKEEQPNTPSDLLSPSPVKDPFQSPPAPPQKKNNLLKNKKNKKTESWVGVHKGTLFAFVLATPKFLPRCPLSCSSRP